MDGKPPHCSYKEYGIVAVNKMHYKITDEKMSLKCQYIVQHYLCKNDNIVPFILIPHFSFLSLILHQHFQGSIQDTVNCNHSKNPFPL